MTLEKGLSYNFTVGRIAEAKHSYYYVIKVEDKECWVKMLPFEVYQTPPKNIIRCEYRGKDSYGSHLFMEDKLSILYELYKVNKAYTFYYVKDTIDMSGNECTILRDNYGLTHSFYGELSPEQKEKKTPVKCLVVSIDKVRKSLLLKPYSIFQQSSPWIDIESLFKSVNKEMLINEYFYDILHNIEDKTIFLQINNINSLIKQHDNEWIRLYILFLDRNFKYNIIRQGDLVKLYDFSQLMLSLITWGNSNYQWKKMPKLTKYEGLSKAISLLQNNQLQDFLSKYIASIQTIGIIGTKGIGDTIKDGNVILSSIEIDPLLFQTRTVLYVRIGELFHKNETIIYPKFIKAFIGILSYRLNIEISQIQQDIVKEEIKYSQVDPQMLLKTLAVLGVLIIFLKEKVKYKTFFQHYKTVFHRLKHIFLSIQQKEANQYVYSLIEEIDNDTSFTWDNINNIHLATIPEKFQETCFTMEHNMVKSEDSMANKQPVCSPRTTDDTILAHWNLYKDGSYIISKEADYQKELLKSIPLLESYKNGFLLLCYNKGNVNKIPIRRLLEKKKRNFKYINGYYQQAQLKEIYTIKSECFILILSLYQKEKYIKLYSTRNISQHTSLSLKGNQVVDSIIDEAEYYLIPCENEEILPQRIIYSSPTPLGKNIANTYYEKDILTLGKWGINI